MAKVIKNPIEVTLHFDHDDGIWELKPTVHYGVSAEEYPDLNIRRGLAIVLTPAQEAAVKQMAADVIYPQILAKEGIS